MLNQKQILRTQFKKTLLNLTDKSIKHHSTVVFKRVIELKNFKQAKTLFIYLAKQNEVQTKAIIDYAKQQDKIILVPKVKDKVMLVVKFEGWQALQLNDWGIFEPISSQIWSKEIDLTLVPGLAFTSDGWRLGRGGGFYDRFLQQHPLVFSVGLAHPEQITGDLPVEAHDQQLDLVIAAD